MTMMRLVVGWTAVLVVAACGSGTGIDCDTAVEPGIGLAVVNAVNGAPEGFGAEATARPEDGADVQMFEARDVHLPPEERKQFVLFVTDDAEFDISVQKDGFERWQMEDVKVEVSGPCNEPETVGLRAELVPLDR